jgi:HPt (histidine-containing phosphotransfer) domain-containing protein
LRDVLGPVMLKVQQQKFVDEILAGLEQLLAFSRSSDFLEISQLAHRLAGSASVFGAKTIALKLSKIETSVTDHMQEQIEQILAEISLLIQIYKKMI